MRHRLLIGICIIAALAFPAFAQTPSGEISGTVVDSSGSVLPGVRVTLTNAATNAIRLTQSNETGRVRVSGGATRQLQPEGRARGLLDRRANEHQRAGGQREPLSVHARDRPIDGRRLGCGRHPGYPDAERVYRHRHREPQHRRAAAERPQLPAARVADSGRHDQRARVRSGTAAHGRPAQQLLAERRRPAHSLQPLLARRHREHRPQFQQLHAAAVGRRARGVQGRVRHLRRRVRPRGRADQREHEIGDKRLPRKRVRVHAQCKDGCEELLRSAGQTDSALHAKPVRNNVRRPGHQQQAVLHVQLGRAAREEVADEQRVAAADAPGARAIFRICATTPAISL